MEATACVPSIIATDVPDCRGIVQHKNKGLLVPVKDPTAFAPAIERLLTDKELRIVIVRKTLNLYCCMLGER